MRKPGAQLCGTSQVAIHYLASKHKLQQIVFVVSIHRLVRLHECAKLINGATVGAWKLEEQVQYYNTWVIAHKYGQF